MPKSETSRGRRCERANSMTAAYISVHEEEGGLRPACDFVKSLWIEA